MPNLGNLVATIYHCLLKIIVHLESDKSLHPESLRPHYQTRRTPLSH